MDVMKLATIGMCLGLPFFPPGTGTYGIVWGNRGNVGGILGRFWELKQLKVVGNSVISQPTSQFCLELTKLPKPLEIYIAQWEHGLIQVWMVLAQDVLLFLEIDSKVGASYAAPQMNISSTQLRFVEGCLGVVLTDDV